MPDFNQNEANRRLKELLARTEKVKSLLVNDVINYYYNDFPETEEEEEKIRAGMRKYLKYAYDDIGGILDDLNRGLGY